MGGSATYLARSPMSGLARIGYHQCHAVGYYSRDIYCSKSDGIAGEFLHMTPYVVFFSLYDLSLGLHRRYFSIYTAHRDKQFGRTAWQMKGMLT